jgi:hypothetical protein
MITFKHLSGYEFVIELNQLESDEWECIQYIYNKTNSCAFENHHFLLNGKTILLSDNKPSFYDNKIIYMRHTLR